MPPVSVLDAAPNSAYTVGVRALCEFTAKQGDLDLRFTPSPTAQEGIEGHAQVVARRPASYQYEVALHGKNQDLLVKGRADGYWPERAQVEEIKTYRGDFDRIPDNHRALHLAQAKVYGHLLCQKLGVDELRVAVIYFNVDTKLERIVANTHSAAELREFFEAQCALFLAWAHQEMRHRQSRDAALAEMVFPYPQFRVGQRELAEAMYKASARACCLLAQAPTGIGKTLASIFPMLKACKEHQLDKLFFLAAKTSGRQLALDALSHLQQTMHQEAPAIDDSSTTTAKVRVIELVAKSKACEHPDKACHGESCPLAQGFYDRLASARAAALQVDQLDQRRMREVALRFDVCPYYLSMEMSKWADVVVGDYNYYFDLNAMLYGQTIVNEHKVAVLVDEAHNLVSRARSMYSAELSYASFKAMRKTAPAQLKKALERLARQWRQLQKSQDDDYLVHSELPEKFIIALGNACVDIADFFNQEPTAVLPELQSFYLDALLLSKLCESFGEHSLFDVHVKRGESTLCVRNIVPAPFLKHRFAASHCTALFSATLSPWNYYSDLLGMPDNTAWIDVPSPFKAEQLSVRVVDQVSTRYQDRSASLPAICQVMAQQWQQQPGNYLAFFSSFDYMEQARERFTTEHPDITVWTQTRHMDESDRKQFINNFTEHSQGIAFAVLGGAFGEGIDLPGKRLIGAFIATLGLPQLNPINEHIRQHMQTMFGAGYDYTYLYPGLQKVVQAAGRVIRTTEDQGVIYLMDDRFNQAQVRALLPTWWRVER
ncbi:ATP-dependent DNA helicase [Undibacterium cyanobacteriorum]|uniref:ATP-dependent DNA helicase n=1 Tax=Undibacterium cyanobacteriorum TaxID=3073561 RepID=A0ABY9RFY6_9BURK|nr:ATP-dependent DNA helicase [Undibacterium sp. 20NA77.5]WMW80129.1 ATP-dependent DNA helicase [Undibacterium sp. 20NA77.5]